MPAYNAGRYLATAIESVLAQTYQDFELIIINDGSVDGTRAIAEAYAGRDRRVRVINQTNCGVAATLMVGLKQADHELVAIMHADDVMLPTRLARQVEFLQTNPGVAVVSSLVYNIDSEGRIIARSGSPITSIKAAQEARDRHELVAVHHPGVMFRKSVVLQVGGYRQQFVPSEDLDLWARIMEKGHLVVALPEYLLSYRIHGTAASVANARGVVLKHRWVKMCAECRRAGRPEPSWEQFNEQLRARPFFRKLDENRKDTAKILYKKAVENYAGRRRWRMLIPLFGAIMLQPLYVKRQIAGKLLSKRGHAEA